MIQYALAFAVVGGRRVTKWQTSDVPKLSEPSDDLLVQIVDDLGFTDPEKRKLAKHHLSAHANSFALGRYLQRVYPTVHQDAATFREISDALKVVADKMQALNPMMSAAIAEAWRQRRVGDDGKLSFGELQAELGELQMLAEQVGRAKFSNKQRDEVLRNAIGGLMLLLEKLTGKRTTVRKRDSDLGLPPELSSPEARTIGRLLRVTEPDLEDTTIVNVITAIRRKVGNGPLDEFEHQLVLGGQVTHF